MTAHPNDELIARYLIGEADAADLEHLRACSICRRECEREETALTAFRGSVRRWSDREFATLAPFQPNPRSAPIAGANWIMAFLLLLVAVGWKVASDTPTAEPLPSSAERDAALLDDVHRDLSRPVPSGMEPLLTFVSQ